MTTLLVGIQKKPIQQIQPTLEYTYRLISCSHSLEDECYSFVSQFRLSRLPQPRKFMPKVPNKKKKANAGAAAPATGVDEPAAGFEDLKGRVRRCRHCCCAPFSV